MFTHARTQRVWRHVSSGAVRHSAGHACVDVARHDRGVNVEGGVCVCVFDCTALSLMRCDIAVMLTLRVRAQADMVTCADLMHRAIEIGLQLQVRHEASACSSGVW
jgi:hypothetical protein